MEQHLLFKFEDETQEKCPTDKADGTTSRSLKIEEDGDPFNGGIKPKIRLKGNWLERAGFKPGTRVNVTCIAHGVMELRSIAQAFVRKEAL